MQFLMKTTSIIKQTNKKNICFKNNQTLKAFNVDASLALRNKYFCCFKIRIYSGSKTLMLSRAQLCFNH